MASVPLEIRVEQRLGSLWGQPRESTPYTIFRIPADVRKSNKALYEPRMVSIGPYYNGKDSLQIMEEHKWRYLRDFISRNSVDVKVYIQEMKNLETEARRCYCQNPKLDPDKFAEMLLLDGCFILELFFKWHAQEPDALCDVGWGLTVICSDLLLLENQIPFFVIEALYNVVAGPEGRREFLIRLLAEHFKDDEAPAPTQIPHGDILHLLHFYYECFVPKREPRRPVGHAEQSSRLRPSRVIPCASELSQAGVRFRKKGSPSDMLDITFEKGIMEMPLLEIHYTKRSLLVNLIAFEQSKGEEAQTLASYVALLDSLINTAKDIELLQRRGIIDNMLSSEDEAADFFNHMGDCSTLDYETHHFAGLFEDVKDYCNSKRHRHRARLMHDYFGSPWTIISVVAATLLIVLAALQTYFTVFPRK